MDWFYMLQSLAELPPPPTPPPPDMDFAAVPRLERLSGRDALLQGPPHMQHWRPRIGRGGRLIFDRADWRLRLPLSAPAEEARTRLALPWHVYSPHL